MASPSTMEKKPRITIKLSVTDKAVEVVCVIILLALWGGTIIGFPNLPEQIPTHFNGAGQVDDHGDKTNIFILPVVATVIYFGMTILNRYPQIYNYPATVTNENARRLYTSATRLIRILKLIVVVVFSIIVLQTYRSAFTKGDGLGEWFLPVVIALLFIPTIAFLLFSQRSRKVGD
jgi:uncharacterized membrane protein